jgi:hypothetical protein
MAETENKFKENNYSSQNNNEKKESISKFFKGLSELINENKYILMFGLLTITIMIIVIVGYNTDKVKMYWDDNNNDNDKPNKTKKKPTTLNDIYHIIAVICISTFFMLLVAFISKNQL